MHELQTYIPDALILAGGHGTRLDEITHGKYHKTFVPINRNSSIRGIDHIMKVIRDNRINTVHLISDTYISDFEDYAAEVQDCKLFQQIKYGGTGGAIVEFIESSKTQKQLLVMASDMYVSSSDVRSLLLAHKDGQITWGVSKPSSTMQNYHGLVVDNTTHAILGDVALSWWKNWNYPNTTLYTKGGVHLIDPTLFLKEVELFQRLSKRGYPIDLYWDILPLMEEQNRRRIERRKTSILQAVSFTRPVIDFGTPEGLVEVRKLYGE